MQIRHHADAFVNESKHSFSNTAMYIQSCVLENVRCLEKVELQLDNGVNVFLGDNGAGKTSILEGVYLLSRGNSFRLQSSRRLIRDDQEQLLVRARCLDEKGHKSHLGIAKSNEQTQIRLNQEKQSRFSDLAKHCPVLILEPGQHRLLEDGPNLRRRYLDWSVFHVKHLYLKHWQACRRSLKQRNELLRRLSQSELSAWDAAYSQHANAVDGLRKETFDSLRSHIEYFLEKLLPEQETIEIHYRRGWNSSRSLDELLKEQYSVDRERGFTQSGPHRAEIRVQVDKRPAKECLSRGQQKLLIAAMVLGQARQLNQDLEKQAVLLIDDFAAELGQGAKERLWACISDSPFQSLISVLHEHDVPEKTDAYKMFHVKHGCVTAVL